VVVLGISAYYHDSAAALLKDGEILGAAQEERFTRRKHDASFPNNAIAACLKFAKLRAQDLDFVAFYEKPFLKFERLLETYLAHAPKGVASFNKAMPLWVKNKLFQKHSLIRELTKLADNVDWEKKLLFAEHHQSHAASAFFPSPFKHAAILTVDGVGEWATASAGIGHNREIVLDREMHFPHSLGLLYSAFTYYIGFSVNSGEYKVMGLAPYGEPSFTQTILEHLIEIRDDGSFHLDPTYFEYCTGLTMTNDQFHALFGGHPRQPHEPLTQRHMNLAASIQNVTEIAMCRMAKCLAKDTNQKRLCLAGGVALNCVANSKILDSGSFESIWVQPAAGDAGGALGAALAAYHLHLQRPRTVLPCDSMKGAYLGPSFSQDEIEQQLTYVGAKFLKLKPREIIENVVDALAAEKAVGWFQGRMEFGPRALGSRSILGDARSPAMQRILNLKIKYRESFRPFAPSVLREDVADWFNLDCDSPYMLFVAGVKSHRRREMTPAEISMFGIDKLNAVRSDIPAVTHVDYSARIQTVHKETNPRYHALLSAFKDRTGCPVLVNTSFNIRGEPIVCTPRDAFKCFMGTDIDVLAIGDLLLLKERQDQSLKYDYRDALQPD
jgi:carbamoyltransferase